MHNRTALPERPKTLPSTEAVKRRWALRFYGDEFVFDTVSGMFYRLSPTGSFILRALDNGMKPEALPEALEARYGVDRARATRDIELFLNELTALEPLDPFAHDNQPPT